MIHGAAAWQTCLIQRSLLATRSFEFGHLDLCPKASFGSIRFILRDPKGLINIFRLSRNRTNIEKTMSKDATPEDAYDVLPPQLHKRAEDMVVPRWRSTCPLPFGEHLQEESAPLLLGEEKQVKTTQG